MAIVRTDKLDYAPGEIATITLTDIDPGMFFNFTIQEWASDPGDDNIVNTYYLDPVIDGEEGDLDGEVNGQIITEWLVPADPDGDGPLVASALNATLDLTAVNAGTDDILGTDDDITAVTTFTDAGGAYTLNFAAADPSIYIPEIPFPSDLAAPTGRGDGDPLIPLAEFNNSLVDVRVESLAPEDMALGQIVPFEVKITVDGDTTPENGVISFQAGWNIVTTNSGDFGYDESWGVIGAFIDTGDGAHIDSGDDATVDSFSWTIVGDEIIGTFTVSGLDDGDEVVLDPWLVLEDTIPAGIGGNVQSRLISAQTVVPGANEKQEISNDAIAGTFQLQYIVDNKPPAVDFFATTVALNFNATAEEVEAALNFAFANPAYRQLHSALQHQCRFLYQYCSRLHRDN